MRLSCVLATLLLQLILSSNLRAQPALQANCSPGVVVSSASYYGRVAPDSIASMFGIGLAARAEAGVPDALGQMPFEVAGTSISVDGRPARLFYVSPGMVNFLVPKETQVGNSAKVEVRAKSTGRLIVASADIDLAAPGIFMTGSFRGDRAAARNAVTFGLEPFSVVTPENFGEDKATRLALFATGVRFAGQTSAIGPNDLNVAHAVQVEAISATGKSLFLPLEYAGPAPLYSGLDQLNVVLPEPVRSEGLLRIRIRTGRTSSNWATIRLPDLGAPVAYGLLYTMSPIGSSSQPGSAADSIAVDALGSAIVFEGSKGVLRRIGQGNDNWTDRTFAGLTGTSPAGIAVDLSGNIFVAQPATNRVLMISLRGDVQSIAGTGKSGFSGDEGQAKLAQLYAPRGIALDRQGNLYIADTGNHRIRMISPGGIIRTVAGTGKSAFSGDGGPALGADLNSPQGLAVDSSGNVYVADTGNNRVRLVTSEGLIVSVAGNGAGPSQSSPASEYAVLSTIAAPIAVALDRLGSLLILEQNSTQIKKVSSDGRIANIVFVSERGNQVAADRIIHALAADFGGDVYLSAAGDSPGSNQLLVLKPDGLLSGQNPALLSLSSPTLALVGGCSTVATISLASPAAEQGSLVRLESSDPALQVPSTIFVPPGANSSTFVVVPVRTIDQKSILVTAHLDSSSTELKFVISPNTTLQLSGLTLAPGVVTSGSPFQLTANLNGVAPPGGVTLSLRSSNPAVLVPPSIKIAPGGDAASILVQTSAVTSRQAVLITAEYGGSSQSIELILNAGAGVSGNDTSQPQPSLSSLVVSKPALTGVDATTGTIILSRPAPASGVQVSLRVSGAALRIPSHINIPAGETTGIFPISSLAVTLEEAVTLTAGLNVSEISTTVVLQPSAAVTSPVLQNLSISPSQVTAGSTATGTLSLSAPATAQGIAVALTSGNSAVQVPATLIVPAGQTTATFSVTTTDVVAATDAEIGAAWAGTRVIASMRVTLRPVNTITVTSVSLSANTIDSGGTLSGTVTLSGPAPSNGLAVALQSSNGAAQLPSSITIASGQTSGSFTVIASDVSSSVAAIITATANSSSASTGFTIKASSTANNEAQIASVSISPGTIVAGSSATGSLTLSQPAPAQGLTVALQSDIAQLQLPATLTITGGQTSATFVVQTSTSTPGSTVTVRASLNGSSASTTLIVTLAPVDTVTVASVAVPATAATGPTSLASTVTLSGPAPSGGLMIALQSSVGAVQVPSTVFVSGGQSSASFQTSISAVFAPISATITASVNGSSASTAIALQTAIVQVTGVSVSPASVVGGSSASGSVSLSSPAPAGGIAVALLSSDSAATVPATIHITAGATSGSFALTTQAVSASVTILVSASVNGASSSANLVVNPPAASGAKVVSVSISPGSVTSGGSASGLVTLSAAAPAGGQSVTLQSNHTTAVVPASILVAANQVTGSFAVSTSATASSTEATITASANGGSASANIAITPVTPCVSALALSTNITDLASGLGVLTGSVSLSSAAPDGGIAVQIKVGGSTIGTIQVLAGQTSALANLGVPGLLSFIGQTANAITTGTCQTVSSMLELASARVGGLSLSLSSVVGGNPVVGTVTLLSPSPTGGTAVSLQSNTASIQVPASVTVPFGQISATFTVATNAVSTETSGNITAAANGGASTSSLTLRVPDAVAVMGSLTVSPTAVIGGNSATATVILTLPAPSGGATVNLQSSVAAIQVPLSVAVAAGQTSTSFAIATSAVTSPGTGLVTAVYNNVSASANLVVNPAPAPCVSALHLSVNITDILTGSGLLTGNVSLTGPAPQGGLPIQFVAASGTVGNVVLPEGLSSTNVSLSVSNLLSLIGSAVTAVTSPPCGGINVTLQLSNPLVSSVVLGQASISGSGTTNATIHLAAPAPSGGVIITLTSSSAAVSLPPTIAIAAGSTSASVLVTTTNPATLQLATITASAGNSRTAVLTVNPAGPRTAVIATISINVASLIGSASALGTVTLSLQAVEGGVHVALSSNNAAVSVPATVFIAAGQTSATFAVSTIAVGSEVLASISAASANTLSAALSVAPPCVQGLTLSTNSVLGGSSSTGTITLTGPAPAGGSTVALAYAGAGITGPATLLVPQGASSGVFAIGTAPVATLLSGVITGALGSCGGVTATLAVQAPLLSSLSISPATLNLLGQGTGTVTLSSPAPAGGLTVALSTSIVGNLLGMPSIAVVPAGASSVQFTINNLISVLSGLINPVVGSVNASLNGVVKTALLTLRVL